MKSLYIIGASLMLWAIPLDSMPLTPPVSRITYDNHIIGSYKGRYTVVIRTSKTTPKTLEFLIRDYDGIAFYEVRRNNIPVHKQVYSSGEEPLEVLLKLNVAPNDKITLETADVYNAKTEGLTRILPKQKK